MPTAYVRVEGLHEFMRDLGRFAPEVRKEFRQQAKQVMSGIVTAAKSRASWSRRIPRAIGPTVTTRYVGVRVTKRKAPHGPLYERGSRGSRSGSSFRHPLFGNRKFWFTEQTRPFVQPAVDEHRDDAIEGMLDAIDDAKRKVGLQ